MNEKYIRDDYNKIANINSPFYTVILSEKTAIFISDIVESGFIKNKKINKNLAFDVGAYVGSSIPRIRSMGFNDVVCFEADPENYKLLKGSL